MRTGQTRWDRSKAVALRLEVDEKTVRRWAVGGWVTSRREGPRLLYIKVHHGGDLDGRPVGLDEHLSSGTTAAGAGSAGEAA